MRIAVCLKYLPATSTEVRIAPGGGSLRIDAPELTLNPYDEYALEAALRLREKHPGSTILALSVGGEEALKCLQYALALKADEALQIQWLNPNPGYSAQAVAIALREFHPDLIFCGKHAIDDGQWLFPGALAEALDWPHASALWNLDVDFEKGEARGQRISDRGEETLTLRMPAVVSWDRGLTEPRIPTLKNRLAARRMQPMLKTLADLKGLPPTLENAVRRLGYLPPVQKPAPRLSHAAAPVAAAELVRWLTTETPIFGGKR